MHLPDRESWVDVHVDIAGTEFTNHEKRIAFEWCHSLMENPRREPKWRNPSDSELFGDTYFAWLPDTDIDAQWVVDDDPPTFYLISVRRPPQGGPMDSA